MGNKIASDGPLSEGNKVLKRLVENKVVVRTLSSLVLIPIILYVLYNGGLLYILSVMAISILALLEWVKIIHNKQMTLFNRVEWYIFGLLYSSLFIWTMCFLRSNVYGTQLVLWLCIMVWSTDIAAYFGGITFRGPKLMPKISASKTWSGSISGVVVAMMLGIFFQNFLHAALSIGLAYSVSLCLLVSVVAQIGDLLESAFKRHFGVKNSGRFVPGHGGILDRIDSLCLAALFLAAILYYLELRT